LLRAIETKVLPCPNADTNLPNLRAFVQKCSFYLEGHTDCSEFLDSALGMRWNTGDLVVESFYDNPHSFSARLSLNRDVRLNEWWNGVRRNEVPVLGDTELERAKVTLEKEKAELECAKIVLEKENAELRRLLGLMESPKDAGNGAYPGGVVPPPPRNDNALSAADGDVHADADKGNDPHNAPPVAAAPNPMQQQQPPPPQQHDMNEWAKTNLIQDIDLTLLIDVPAEATSNPAPTSFYGALLLTNGETAWMNNHQFMAGVSIVASGTDAVLEEDGQTLLKVKPQADIPAESLGTLHQSFRDNVRLGFRVCDTERPRVLSKDPTTAAGLVWISLRALLSQAANVYMHISGNDMYLSTSTSIFSCSAIDSR
jgi:hypothetical protein